MKKINFNIDQLENVDNEEGFSLSKQQYKPKSAKQEYVENALVDLGLPSGTLWSKYNLGATLNSNAESWYGDYYAWGEIKPKYEYLPSNYKFGDENNRMTKYCDQSRAGSDGYVDDITILQLKDDVANYTNKNLRIPSEDQFEELFDNCKGQVMTNYQNVEGLNGILFTSKINGEVLFFPACGYKSIRGYHYGYDSYGQYWTSNLKIRHSREAMYCGFNAVAGASYNNNLGIYNTMRYEGSSIRPVQNKLK